MQTAILIASLVFSTAALTVAVLLYAILAPSALAQMIEQKTKRVVVPGSLFDQIATDDNLRVSSLDIESPSTIGKRSHREHVPFEDEGF